jgi:serine/threonine-protein kinase
MSAWWTAVLAALGVLAVIALGIGLALSHNNGDNGNATAQISVPQLIGLTDTQAKQALATAGLTGFKASDPDTSTGCAKGKVSAQDPTAGNKVAADATGSYTLCTGPAEVKVPTNLVNGTKDNADSTLKGLGLVPVYASADSTSARDLVLKVEHAGDSVDPGTEITVTISRGNQTVVPSVVGKSQEVAQALLQAAGFNVNVKTVDAPGTPGTVVDQNPAGKSKQTTGSNVTIEVVQSDAPPSDNPSPGDTTPPPGGGNGGGGNGGGGGPISNLFH